jgi:hypothetical protein
MGEAKGKLEPLPGAKDQRKPSMLLLLTFPLALNHDTDRRNPSLLIRV